MLRSCRLKSSSEMNQNKEAFCLLHEEFSRALMLLREINFCHLTRLTNDLARHISGNEHRNKNNDLSHFA